MVHDPSSVFVDKKWTIPVLACFQTSTCLLILIFYRKCLKIAFFVTCFRLPSVVSAFVHLGRYWLCSRKGGSGDICTYMLTHAYLKIRSKDQDSMASCGASDQAQCTASPGRTTEQLFPRILCSHKVLRSATSDNPNKGMSSVHILRRNKEICWGPWGLVIPKTLKCPFAPIPSRGGSTCTWKWPALLHK